MRRNVLNFTHSEKFILIISPHLICALSFPKIVFTVFLSPDDLAVSVKLSTLFDRLPSASQKFGSLHFIVFLKKIIRAPLLHGIT